MLSVQHVLSDGSLTFFNDIYMMFQVEMSRNTLVKLELSVRNVPGAIQRY